MGYDNRGTVGPDGFAEQFANPYMIRVQRANILRMGADHTVLGVKHQNPQLLLFQQTHLGLDEIGCITGGTDLRPRLG